MRLLQPLKWYGAGPKSAVRLLNQVTLQCDAEKTSQASLRGNKYEFRRNIEFISENGRVHWIEDRAIFFKKTF